MLADIMTVQAYNPPAVVTRNPHVFEIKTPTSTFFVGEDPTRGKIDPAEGPVVNSAGITRYWSIFTECNGSFTLPGSDSDSDSDCHSKPNGYIAVCRSFHTAQNQIQFPILIVNYINGIGIRVCT